jgi:hypothetical protein
VVNYHRGTIHRTVQFAGIMRVKGILVFIAHQFTATLGVGFAAAVLAFFSFEILRPLDSHFFTSRNASQLLTGLP